MPANLRHIALLIVVAAVYFLAGKLGLHFFGLVHPSASAVWPPTGVAIAALLLFGYRAWPALFVGAFAVNVTTAGSLFTSLGIAAGNTFEALVAVFLIHRWASGSAVFLFLNSRSWRRS
jgi:integral membrane sensor domain MASE1